MAGNLGIVFLVLSIFSAFPSISESAFIKTGVTNGNGNTRIRREVGVLEFPSNGKNPPEESLLSRIFNTFVFGSLVKDTYVPLLHRKRRSLINDINLVDVRAKRNLQSDRQGRMQSRGLAGDDGSDPFAAIDAEVAAAAPTTTEAPPGSTPASPASSAPAPTPAPAPPAAAVPEESPQTTDPLTPAPTKNRRLKTKPPTAPEAPEEPTQQEGRGFEAADPTQAPTQEPAPSEPPAQASEPPSKAPPQDGSPTEAPPTEGNSSPMPEVPEEVTQAGRGLSDLLLGTTPAEPSTEAPMTTGAGEPSQSRPGGHMTSASIETTPAPNMNILGGLFGTMTTTSPPGMSTSPTPGGTTKKGKGKKGQEGRGFGEDGDDEGGDNEGSDDNEKGTSEGSKDDDDDEKGSTEAPKEEIEESEALSETTSAPQETEAPKEDREEPTEEPEKTTKTSPKKKKTIKEPAEEEVSETAEEKEQSKKTETEETEVIKKKRIYMSTTKKHKSKSHDKETTKKPTKNGLLRNLFGNLGLGLLG